MAKKVVSKAPDAKLVRCAECKNFVRDTDGISRNVDTHEYFMGRCEFEEWKVFADIPHECRRFKR